MNPDERQGFRRATLATAFLAPTMLIDAAAAPEDWLPLGAEPRVVEIDVTSCWDVNVGVRIVPERISLQGDGAKAGITYLDARGQEVHGDHPDLEGSAESGYHKSLPRARKHQFITFRSFPPPDATSMRLAFQQSESGLGATIANSVLIAAQKRGLSVLMAGDRSALNAGIASAPHSHVTFVGADNVASPSIPTFYCRQTPFLESLESGEHVCFYADLYSKFPSLFDATTDLGTSAHFDGSVVERLAVITHLNRYLKRTMPAEIRALIESTVDAQADAIGLYLRDARDQIGSFRKMVERRNLTYFPWTRLNTTVATRIVFSYCFPPARDVSGISVAKRLVDLNEPCDVICSDMSTVRESDSRLLDLVSSHVGLMERLPTSGGFGDWKRIVEFADTAARRGAEFEQNKKHAYSRMYSRAQWPASHFAATLFKVRRPQIEWTAEFSDPLLMDKYGFARPNPCDLAWLAEHGIFDAIREKGFAADQGETRLFYWCEMLPYMLADRIVFTNESQLKYMLSYCSDDTVRRTVEEKAEISPHPVPHEWARSGARAYHLDYDCTNLAYFGSIFANRSLGVLFEALAALSTEERQRLRLYVFTRQIAETQEEVDAWRLWDAVFVLPEMEYLEFLTSLDEFDALVVIDVDRGPAAGPNPYLPAKLSDYATSKTPILAIHERGSELSKRPEPTYRCEIQQPGAFLDNMVQLIREILSSKLAKTTPH